MQIEHLPLNVLKAAPHNSRTHSAEQVAQIVASMKEFGFTNPILIDEGNEIIAGHGRLAAAQSLGMNDAPCVRLSGLSDAQKRAYVIADNSLPLNADWDIEILRSEVGALQGLDFNIDLLGFDSGFLDSLLTELPDGPQPDDQTPELQADPVSVEGDVWILDGHRVMCGDSTSMDAVAKLCAGTKAQLIHADPPYGMGKQKDGVANDNIYREELDAFQMEWWTTFRLFAVENASAYIWGNAPDLWRLWYTGGLGNSEHLELKNEIVWDKKDIPGMKSDLMTQYPEASERCLFFQIGDQMNGNINTEDYFEGWDAVRLYLKGEADAVGLTPKALTDLCGVQMFSHWFTKSRWTIMPRNHYETLGANFPCRFARPWGELKKTHDEAQAVYRGKVSETRSHFDNAHDIMRDVWEFPRVVGDDRHGHATPKPVEMMERVMKTSLPPGGVCLEPFGGSGATLMGAERTGRKCHTMDLQAQYVDVIVRRWQNHTGKKAINEETGQTFAEVEG